MDILLYLRFLIKYILILGGGFFIIDLIWPSKTDYTFWTIYILFLTTAEYIWLQWSGNVQGISKGHENYLRVKYEARLETSKSEEEIIKAISTKDEYLGEVKFEGAVIKKHQWKGIMKTSQSEIIKMETHSVKTTYMLKTKPRYNWIKIDHYYNLEYFEILKYLVTGKVYN